MSKVYMIVTNDKYETPVKCDVIGAKAVAEYMGISLSYLRCMLCGAVPWSVKQKYKAVCLGEANLTDNTGRRYAKRYAMTHDRTAYDQKYWRRKHGKAGVKQGE